MLAVQVMRNTALQPKPEKTGFTAFPRRFPNRAFRRHTVVYKLRINAALACFLLCSRTCAQCIERSAVAALVEEQRSKRSAAYDISLPLAKARMLLYNAYKESVSGCIHIKKTICLFHFRSYQPGE